MSNTGSTEVTISSIAISGDFAQTSTCGSSVAAGANCAVSVTFTPTAAGSRTGMLTITDNAPGSPHLVALAGTGEDFSIAASSGSSNSATVKAGGSASYQLSLAPEGGFSGTLSLACSGAPSQATCTVNPTSVTLNGSGNNTTFVFVSTTAGTMASPRNIEGPPRRREEPLLPILGDNVGVALAVWLLALLALVAAVYDRRTRTGVDLKRCAGLMPHGQRRVRRFVFATLLLLSLGWAACGGGNSVAHNPGTPAGAYSLTVTATYTSGSTTLTHHVNLTLTVN